jgi:hypothetical protein
VTIGSSIYLLGGQDEFSGVINLAVNQIYNVETDTWSLGSPMPIAVYRASAGVTSGFFAPQRIYLVGGHPGEGSQATDIVQVYDPISDTWGNAASMPSKRMDLAVAVVDDRLYAVGGAAHYYFWPGPESTAENLMYTPMGYTGSPSETSLPDPSPTTTPSDGGAKEPFPIVLVVLAAVAFIILVTGLLVFIAKLRISEKQ